MWTLAAAAAAMAAEPTIEVDDAGYVRAKMTVAAPVASVSALLADPEQIARIDGTTQVTATAEADGCKRVRTHVDHPVATVDYVARACPDGANAWVYTLVEGSGMSAYDARWEVVAADGGTEVRYAIRTVPSLPVPQFVVTRSTVSGVSHLFERMAAALEK